MARIDYEAHDDVAQLRWDDGKANALSMETLAELNDAIDRAEKEAAKALLLIGRQGVFCAGFDLAALGVGGDGTRTLVRGGAELLIRLYGLSIPVAIACTGHSLGLGALLLLAADLRFGAPGPHKIGLNEVAISLPLPTFGVELATARLSRRHLTRSTQLAEIYDPEGAVDAGFLDRVCAEGVLHDQIAAETTRLAGLGGKAFAITKQRLREATIERIRASLEDEF